MIQTLEEYLKVCSEFKLGHLPTEGFHPSTTHLSRLALDNLLEAYEVLKEVDLMAYSTFIGKENEILKLHYDIWSTIHSGGKVFLVGCGATGRLSIALESLYRQKMAQFQDRVISFMAGGDVALLKSLEKFEDEKSYGERQLIDLGFSSQDLLVAITEGGETSFVIGACEAAARISKVQPYFLYCNPEKNLSSIERSKKVLDNPNIKKINLHCGPMALSGSTRMQASTIQMASVGMALLNENLTQGIIESKIKTFLKFLKNLNYFNLSHLTFKEAELYQNKQYVLYQTTSDLGVSILTDTTERSPTFNLDSFENFDHPDDPISLCYLNILDTHNALEAWESILGRRPRTLEWPEMRGLACLDRLKGFDISDQVFERRSRLHHQQLFEVRVHHDELIFDLEGESAVFDIRGLDILETHLVIKMLLNAHSTLIMGRLGRYLDNIMTWVKPSNLKLIDRSIRYVQKLLENRDVQKTYEEIAQRVFELKDKTKSDRPIVMAVFESFMD